MSYDDAAAAAAAGAREEIEFFSAVAGAPD